MYHPVDARPETMYMMLVQVVDIKALRKLAGSLSPASLRQSFNSADFYIFGKTLGEGAYGKVRDKLTHVGGCVWLRKFASAGGAGR